VNEAKTRRCRVWNESFDFLGYTIGKCHSPVTGRAYIGTRPSRKKIARLCQAIHAMTGRDMVWAEVEDRIVRLNRLLAGWANYFCLGPVSKAYRLVDQYTVIGSDSGCVQSTSSIGGRRSHDSPTNTWSSGWA